MLGLMLIKGALLQSLAILPLPLLSVIVWLSYSSMFGRSQRVLSLRAATDLDKRDRVRLASDDRCKAMHSFGL